MTPKRTFYAIALRIKRVVSRYTTLRIVIVSNLLDFINEKSFFTTNLLTNCFFGRSDKLVAKNTVKKRVPLKRHGRFAASDWQRMHSYLRYISPVTSPFFRRIPKALQNVCVCPIQKYTVRPNQSDLSLETL